MVALALQCLLEPSQRDDYGMWWMLGSNCKLRHKSHIRSIGFWCEVYKAVDSPTTMTSFCGVVLRRFLSIGNRIFHHVAELQRVEQVVTPIICMGTSQRDDCGAWWDVRIQL